MDVFYTFSSKLLEQKKFTVHNTFIIVFIVIVILFLKTLLINCHRMAPQLLSTTALRSRILNIIALMLASSLAV